METIMIRTERITIDLKFAAESLTPIEFADGMNIEEAGENMTFAAHPVASGSGVEFHMHSGAFHGFENTDPPTPVGTRAVNEYVNALRFAFLRALTVGKNND
jgi:acetyl esterase/lipase